MNYLIVQMSAEEAFFARFRKNRGDLVFVEGSRHRLDGEESLPDLLSRYSGKSAEERIILSISPVIVSQREMDLPISDPRKVREILPMELKGEIAADTEDMVFDMVNLGGGKILALWGRRNLIAAEISSLADCGMDPAVVTASVFNWRALLPPEGTTGTIAITDGESIAVFKNGLPLFFRSYGRDEFYQELNRTLAALEIGKGVKIDRLYLHGMAARNSAGVSPCGGLPGFPVAPLPLIGKIAGVFNADASSTLDLAGCYAVASAAADGTAVDFRRGNLAYAADFARIRNKVRLSVILAGIFIMLLLSEVGLRFFFVKKDIDSLNKSISVIYREVFPARKKPVDEVGELRSEIKKLTGPGGVHAILPILKAVAEIKGDDIIGI